MVSEVFKYDKQNKLTINIPDGCKKCEFTYSKDEWQCQSGCLWPENHWKYDEINYYIEMAQWANSGVDLNRIDGLLPNDFYKINIIRKYI